MNAIATTVLLLVVTGLGAILFVAWPLVAAADDPHAAEADRRAAESAAADDLDEAIARSLETIRELDFDRRAGNLSDDDFAALDAAERARAAALIARRDARDRDPSEG